jgi:PAS domain-containing protein
MQFPGSVTDLQSFIEIIPNPVVVKNRAHRIILLNTQACVFLGHTRDILLTRSDEDLYPAGQVRGFREDDDRVFTNGMVSEC